MAGPGSVSVNWIHEESSSMLVSRVVLVFVPRSIALVWHRAEML